MSLEEVALFSIAWVGGLPLIATGPMDNALKISGKKLAALRRRRFMTQEEVAREMKMSTSRIASMEAKDETGVYLTNFKRMAELFKMHPDDLARELKAETPDTTLYPIPTEILDGLKARAALEKSTLDEWLARQATLSVEVYDDDPAPPAAPRQRVQKPKRGTVKGRRPKRPESPDKSNLQCIQ